VERMRRAVKDGHQLKTNKFNSEACKNRKRTKRQSNGQVKLTRCVPHGGLAIYVKKYLKAKRKIIETQIFHHAKNIIFKKTSERNQNPSRYYNSITNLKFQHKPKYHLSKILIK
jgi:hypothetical protein